MFYIIATLEKRTYISIYTNSINNIVNNRYENDIDKRKNIFRGRKVGVVDILQNHEKNNNIDSVYFREA